MKNLALAALAILGVSAQRNEPEARDCTPASSPVTIDYFTFEPNGWTSFDQNMTTTGYGSTSRDIRGGTYRMRGTYTGLPIFDITDTVCEPTFHVIRYLGVNIGEVYVTGFDCPVPTGPSDLEVIANVYRAAPSIGSLDVKMEVFESSTNELMICVDLTLPLP